MSSGFTDPFRYYLPPDANAIKSAMTSGLIVLDTNVLLSAYRFAPAARDELLSVLDSIVDRIWIPHRVAEEFHRNRLEVISDQDAAYMPVLEALRLAQSSLDEELQSRIAQLANRAALSDSERTKLIRLVTKSTESAARAVEKLRKAHGLADLRGDDPILARFQRLLEGRTGPSFSANELDAATVEARRRIENLIPPGYRDVKKVDPYGDYFLWKQTMIEVARRKTPYLVFVTTDNKEDWYEIIKGRTIGARPELTREMMDEAGAHLVMLNTTSFLFHAREHLDATVSPETIRQSETLPKSELIRERELQRDARRRQRRSNIEKLVSRIDSHDVLIATLEEALDRRQADDPEGTSAESRVLRGQIDAHQNSNRILRRRLKGLQAPQMGDDGSTLVPQNGTGSSSDEDDSDQIELEIDLE